VITLFTIPKPFVGDIGRIQRNAIGSWLRLEPTPQVVLMGNDAGVADAAADFGIEHVPDVATTGAGTPLVSDVFGKAQSLSGGEVLAYVNCDIVLFQAFAKTVASCRRRRPYLLVGRRTDIDVAEELDFAPGWQERLRAEVAARGELHAESGMDYFVFRRGLWPSIPPFAVGRFSWDGWLVWSAHDSGANVIDTTRAILAVHQNHPRAGIGTPEDEAAWDREVRENFGLARPYPATFTIRDADRFATASGLVLPALQSRYVWRRLVRLDPRVRGGWIGRPR
jgi:hypothetical protein